MTIHTPNWTIELCTEGDLNQLVNVCEQQWIHGESKGLPGLVVANIEKAYTFEQYVNDNWQTMTLAKAGDEVIGFVYWTKNEVVGLGVLPSWWRRGVGRSLMHHAEQCMREHQIEVAQLEVYDVNQDAVKFYEKLDYTVSHSFVNNDWGLPIITLVMIKTLAA